MALSASLLGAITFTTTAGVKTVVATPTLGDMIIVIVAATGVASGLGVTDNNTDKHGNPGYTPIVTTVKNASADAMTAFVRADPIRQAVSTTWTTSGDGASSGGGLYVMRVTGATLAGPAFIRQSGHQDNGAAAGTPTIALGVAALTTNALITVLLNATSSPTIATPTGFVASPGDVNTGYNTPATGIEGTHANSGVTASTITWGGASATAFGALAFEMSAAQGSLAVSPEIPEINAKQAVKRGSVFCLGEKWAKRGKLWIPAADRPYAVA